MPVDHAARQPPARLGSPISGLILDLDGTLYLGDRALPGAPEAVAELRHSGRRILFVSNNPIQAREGYAAKLSALGIPASPGDVVTSGLVLARHLAETLPRLRLFLIGEDSLRRELLDHGLRVVDGEAGNAGEVLDAGGIDAVVVSFDRTLDYRKLNLAYQALVRGARFFATHTDRVCPMPGGAIPDAGMTIAALEQATGRRVELIAGKPSRLMLEVALRALGLAPDRCLLVGDRLETDIAMGRSVGMRTALTLTGVTRREALDGLGPQPDLVLESVAELPALLDGGHLS